jgi:hypothetical protein
MWCPRRILKSVSLAELVTGSPLILPQQKLHVPGPPCVDVPLPPTRLASYAEAANSPPAHLAKAEYVYVHIGGQQKPLAAPYASPYLRGKELHHPRGPEAGDHLCGPP